MTPGVPGVPAGLLAREQALVQGAAAGGRQQSAAAIRQQRGRPAPH